MPMPKISQAQRDARRQQILDAALRCFSRDGFHATTTADIVRESDVSQGTLYLYFSGKDDIVTALADDRHQGEALLNALAGAEQDPARGLAALIELHGEGLKDPRRSDILRVGVQGWGEALLNPRIHASTTEGLNLVRRAIVAILERGQRTGQVRADLDAESIARTLIAVFQGYILQTVWGEPLDLRACGKLMREMIERAVLTEAGRAAFRDNPCP
jgi:AcrR family transcriptional regulator